jgi:hypothetical protein
MRLLGFVGIFFLALLNVLMTMMSIQQGDWRGIFLMICMAGMLVFFTRALWRGRRMEREGRPPAQTGEWGNRSVTGFLTGQVMQSREGRILLTGSAIALILWTVSLACPAILGLPAARMSKTQVVLVLWPLLAFVLYVQVCGPDFRSSVYKTVIMLAVMCAPVYMLYG